MCILNLTVDGAQTIFTTCAQYDVSSIIFKLSNEEDYFSSQLIRVRGDDCKSEE